MRPKRTRKRRPITLRYYTDPEAVMAKAKRKHHKGGRRRNVPAKTSEDATERPQCSLRTPPAGQTDNLKYRWDAVPSTEPKWYPHSTPGGSTLSTTRLSKDPDRPVPSSCPSCYRHGVPRNWHSTCPFAGCRDCGFCGPTAVFHRLLREHGVLKQCSVVLPRLPATAQASVRTNANADPWKIVPVTPGCVRPAKSEPPARRLSPASVSPSNAHSTRTRNIVTEIAPAVKHEATPEEEDGAVGGSVIGEGPESVRRVDATEANFSSHTECGLSRPKPSPPRHCCDVVTAPRIAWMQRMKKRLLAHLQGPGPRKLQRGVDSARRDWESGRPTTAVRQDGQQQHLDERRGTSETQDSRQMLRDLRRVIADTQDMLERQSHDRRNCDSPRRSPAKLPVTEPDQRTIPPVCSPPKAAYRQPGEEPQPTPCSAEPRRGQQTTVAGEESAQLPRINFVSTTGSSAEAVTTGLASPTRPSVLSKRQSCVLDPVRGRHRRRKDTDSSRKRDARRPRSSKAANMYVIFKSKAHEVEHAADSGGVESITVKFRAPQQPSGPVDARRQGTVSKEDRDRTVVFDFQDDIRQVDKEPVHKTCHCQSCLLLERHPLELCSDKDCDCTRFQGCHEGPRAALPASPPAIPWCPASRSPQTSFSSVTEQTVKSTASDYGCFEPASVKTEPDFTESVESWGHFEEPVSAEGDSKENVTQQLTSETGAVALAASSEVTPCGDEVSATNPGMVVFMCDEEALEDSASSSCGWCGKVFHSEEAAEAHSLKHAEDDASAMESDIDIKEDILNLSPCGSEVDETEMPVIKSEPDETPGQELQDPLSDLVNAPVIDTETVATEVPPCTSAAVACHPPATSTPTTTQGNGGAGYSLQLGPHGLFLTSADHSPSCTSFIILEDPTSASPQVPSPMPPVVTSAFRPGAMADNSSAILVPLHATSTLPTQSAPNSLSKSTRRKVRAPKVQQSGGNRLREIRPKPTPSQLRTPGESQVFESWSQPPNVTVAQAAPVTPSQQTTTDAPPVFGSSDGPQIVTIYPAPGTDVSDPFRFSVPSMTLAMSGDPLNNATDPGLTFDSPPGVASDSAPSRFQCMSCPALFYSQNRLTMHTWCVHAALPFVCGWCSEPLASLLLLQAHILIKHGYPLASGVTCPIQDCPHVTHSTALMSDHLIHSHAKDRAKVLRCDICGFETSLINGLLLHAEEHLAELRSMHCVTCSRWFPSPDFLMGHLTSSQSCRNGRFECPLCKRNTQTSAGMRSHLARRHNGMPAFVCPCGETFKEPDKLRHHALKTMHMLMNFWKLCLQTTHAVRQDPWHSQEEKEGEVDVPPPDNTARLLKLMHDASTVYDNTRKYY